MKDSIRVKKGEIDHAKALQGRLRKADQRELFTSTGKNPDQVILEAWDISHLNKTIMLDDRPVAIFGTASLGEERGCPWMVGSDDVEDKKVQWFIARNSKKYINEMLERYSYLVNFVDTRNELSIRWLKWCGFTFYDPMPFGVFGFPFLKFDMEKNNV